jgi:hypothetical protein
VATGKGLCFCEVSAVYSTRHVYSTHQREHEVMSNSLPCCSKTVESALETNVNLPVYLLLFHLERHLKRDGIAQSPDQWGKRNALKPVSHQIVLNTCRHRLRNVPTLCSLAFDLLQGTS